MATQVQQHPDGSYGAGKEDIWLLKLDADGQIPGRSIMGESSAVVTAIDVTGQATPGNDRFNAPAAGGSGGVLSIRQNKH